MKIVKWMTVVFFGGYLILALSNILGLPGENESIAVTDNSAHHYEKVSRILQNKCVDCHSPGMTRMPIYSNLPIAKELIQEDIKNAQQRFILDKEIYAGEAAFTPLMLARLEHVVMNNTMPPSLYLSMHWAGRLDPAEKETILAWIANKRADHHWSNSSAETFKGEPIQPLPHSANLNPEKVVLGEQLFHETALSGDNTLSCASCHDLKKGGTDQSRVSTGIRGQQGPINAPTVFNAMYNLAQFWDGRAKNLQDQAAGPVANPGEMGEKWNSVVKKLKQVSQYNDTFNRLYPLQGLTKESVTETIASFEKSLLTPNSRFDQYLLGNTDILNNDEKEGYKLFKQNCTSCHFGPVLGGLSYEKMGVKVNYFEIRGGDLTDADNGRFNVTGKETDRHAFKVPVLRNVELTHPYFHDGSVKDLSEAVLIMGEVQVGKHFSQDDIHKIVAFLKTLTGEYKGSLLSSVTSSNLENP